MTLIPMFGSQSTACGSLRLYCVLLVCLLAPIASVGCGSHAPELIEGRLGSAMEEATSREPVAPKRLTVDPPGLHNVVRLGNGLFSGSEPDGPEGFASIARLGAKTIVSVDGARPNLDLAHREGMRYAHIPFGYDGVPAHAGLALARLVRESTDPIYIHCHHGLHRGPAAAAIAWIASGAATSEALKVLETAGTGKEYAGLWRDVENYACPPPETELPELVETAPVESLAAGMARIDRHWDDLKRCRDAPWQAPQEHPDLSAEGLSAEQESLQIREAFYEAGRILPAERFDEAFRARLREAESFAAEIETALKQSDHRVSSAAIANLERCCKQCHETYRN